MYPKYPRYTAGTPRSAGSSGPVSRPSDFGSTLLFLGSSVCPIELYPMRVSSSVCDESVEFQTRPNNAVFCGGLITVLNMSGGPTLAGGTISPTFPAGADWLLYP